MSSLLNKLKGHKHQTSTDASDSYNQPGSATGNDGTSTSGYGNTTSPTHRGETGYGNTQTTSSGHNDGPLNSHSDGGKYYAPKGSAVGQGYNTETVGPHNNDTANRLDPRVDSDQSRLHQNTQQGYGEPGYNQSGYGSNQAGYGNTTQGPHSSNLANKTDPRVDSDNSRGNYGHGTTTTTTTNTSTSVDQYGAHDSDKRLPADPNQPTLLEKANPKVDTAASRAREPYDKTGYGNTAGSNQYSSTHESNKRLPENPNHPTLMEKANPRVDADRRDDYGNTGYGNTTDSSRRHEQPGYGAAGYGDTAGSNQYDNDSNKRLPEDPNHPTMMEKANPKIDTDRRDQYGNTGYGNTTDSSRRNEQPGYGAAGYGNTTGTDQYDHESNKKLPKDPNHPTMMEKLNPKVDTDSSRRNEYDTPSTTYNNATTTSGPHSSNLTNPTDPRIDSDNSSRRHEHRHEHGHEHGREHGREHGHHDRDQYAAGAVGAGAGAYAGREESRHHHHQQAQAVPNDDSTMINRSHPHTSMHPSDRRYDSSRADQQTGADGEYLPGPAPSTAGPHKSDMLNKLDPRVDSDQSKLEKEREREGYGNSGIGGGRYGNEHERRINEDSSRRHEGAGAGIGSGTGHQHDQYNNSPTSASHRDRDSGYAGNNSNVSSLPHRKAVGESGGGAGTYLRDSDNPASSNYDRSGAGAGQGYGSNQGTSTGQGYGSGNTQGTGAGIGSGQGYGNTQGTSTGQGYGNPNTQSSNRYENDENDFECAKCGHHNTHLRKNRGEKVDHYGNPKPTMMEKLNPKVDSNQDGKAGFMK